MFASYPYCKTNLILANQIIFENPGRKPTSARDLHSFVQACDISVPSSSLERLGAPVIRSAMTGITFSQRFVQKNRPRQLLNRCNIDAAWFNRLPSAQAKAVHHHSAPVSYRRCLPQRGVGRGFWDGRMRCLPAWHHEK